MPTRGEQLVRSAAAAAAAPSRFMVVSKTKPCSLVLNHSWDELVAAQPALTTATIANAKEGEWFAIWDRNNFVSNWRNSIIVREGEHFALFDDEGKLRDEPSAGVPNGRQHVEELLSEFDVAGDLWYRPPKHGRSTTRSSGTPPNSARSSESRPETSSGTGGAARAQSATAARAMQSHSNKSNDQLNEQRIDRSAFRAARPASTTVIDKSSRNAQQSDELQDVHVQFLTDAIAVRVVALWAHVTPVCVDTR